jgi:WD40 repeat protein
VSSDDGTVRLWDVTDSRSPRPLRTLTGPTNYVLTAAFSPDGRLVAAPSADRRGYLWDLGRPDGTPLAVLDGLTSYAYFPAFSPDGTRLAAAATGGTAWLCDVSRPASPGDPISLPASEDPLFAVAFSPDGQTLAAAGADRSVHMWTVDPRRASDALCARSGALLTAEEWSRFVGDLPYDPPC